MDYIKLTSSENIYNIEHYNNSYDLPSVGTETEEYNGNMQSGGFFGGSKLNEEKFLKAIRSNKMEVVKFFVEEDLVKDYGYKDEYGKTAVHYLVEKVTSERDDETSDVLNTILSLDSDSVRELLNRCDSNNNTALHVAARNNDDDMCERLIGLGADPLKQNNDGHRVALETVNTSCSSCSPTISRSDFFSLFKSDNNNDGNYGNYGNDGNDENDRNRGNRNDETPGELFMRASDSRRTSEVTTEQLQKLLNGALQNQNNSTQPQAGGTRKTRKLKYYAVESAASTSQDELERMINNQADEIHKRTVEKIVKLLDVDEDTAHDYKNAVYRKVKNEMKDLSYLDRAYEMEKRITKENLKKIDLKKVKKESEELKKMREKEREERKKSKKSKKSKKKGSKKSAKKEKAVAEDKKDKKTKKKEKKEPDTDSETEKILTSDTDIEGMFQLSSTSVDSL